MISEPIDIVRAWEKRGRLGITYCSGVVVVVGVGVGVLCGRNGTEWRDRHWR